MGSVVPFRMSSFFFGRRAGGEALPEETAADGAGGGGGGGGEHACDEALRQPLLDHEDVDLESCHDEGFVFSWRRLLLHVGCGGARCACLAARCRCSPCVATRRVVCMPGSSPPLLLLPGGHAPREERARGIAWGGGMLLQAATSPKAARSAAPP